MDNKWYQAVMQNNHTDSGYEKDLLVYFKFDVPVDNELTAKIFGVDAVKQMLKTIIVYDGNGAKYFKLDSDNASMYIKAFKDDSRRPILAEDQFGIQYNFITKCK